VIPKIKNKVKEQNTWYLKFIYNAYMKLRHADMPVIFPIHQILRLVREIWLGGMDWILSFFINQPIFKLYCKKYGKGIRLYGGIPEILGDLHMYIGNNVSMHGKSTFSAGRVFKAPMLIIGDNSYLGYGLDIMLADKVVIGNNVMIANDVRIIGYDAHPIDPLKRVEGEAADQSGSGVIEIKDNVWVGLNSIILKGVIIGEDSVVAAGSVVTKDVEPRSVVAGNPAKVVKKI